MARRLTRRFALFVICLCLPLGRSALAATAEEGRRLYASRCAFCHGTAGNGDGPAGAALKPPPTNFATTDYWKHATPESIKTVIESGKAGTAMVAFKASLNAEQIDALIAHLRTFNPSP